LIHNTLNKLINNVYALKARQGQCKSNTKNKFFVEAQPVLAFAFLRGKGTAFSWNSQTFPQFFLLGG